MIRMQNPDGFEMEEIDLKPSHNDMGDQYSSVGLFLSWKTSNKTLSFNLTCQPFRNLKWDISGLIYLSWKINPPIILNISKYENKVIFKNRYLIFLVNMVKHSCTNKWNLIMFYKVILLKTCLGFFPLPNTPHNLAGVTRSRMILGLDDLWPAVRAKIISERSTT